MGEVILFVARACARLHGRRVGALSMAVYIIVRKHEWVKYSSEAVKRLALPCLASSRACVRACVCAAETIKRDASTAANDTPASLCTECIRYPSIRHAAHLMSSQARPVLERCTPTKSRRQKKQRSGSENGLSLRPVPRGTLWGE
jgi:hypothetical protein